MAACRKCGASFADADAKFCPKCGVPDPLSDDAAARRRDAAHSHSKPMPTWLWFLLVPVGLFVLFLGFGAMQPSNPEKTNARHAYEACMDSLTADDRARGGNGRFIAGACESMRNDYIRKYGSNP